MPDEVGVMAGALAATAARAAEALLRSLGAGSVEVRFPLSGAGGGLGLAAPVVEAVALAPAAVRVLRAEEGGGARYEVAIAAAAVARAAELRNLASADEFFAAALGIVFEGKLLRIVNVTPHACGAAVCLYRLEARG